MIPLVYLFSDVVAGHGFLVRIGVRGRALLYEAEGFNSLITGVEPAGSFEGQGATSKEAMGLFRRAFTKELFEAAIIARDYGHFVEIVDRFMVVDIDADRWRPLPAPIGGFVCAVRGEDATRPEHHFERLDLPNVTFTPTDNRVDCWWVPLTSLTGD